ncbi:MAG TPA: PAS domain S-box protein [Syntrophales bacterium]|nr:PAS domain S-box protein [Syntrophales bacterium]HOX93561.1 PAS domain S-box protein [Syntrophales bacterium]HPI56762.1 PAS domain S-box protein [Syntrophales bacterium]HPN25927.1 PAS domain S-box protein [Syntrophales bacterium]HQM28765.1 PAS domain S-box protein [Syntrophales bacterium]
MAGPLGKNSSLFDEQPWTVDMLRKERDISAAVLDTAGVLVVVFDREGRIRRFNRACEKITGYSAAEVLGCVFMDSLVPPEDMEGVQKTWNAICAGDFPKQHENHWVAKDGARRMIAWSNTVITREDGSIEYIIGTGLDITERKQMEEALRKANEDLEERVKERTYELHVESLYARSLIEASLDPLVTISVDGKITDVNRASEEITGVPREQLIGSDFSDYFTEPEKARAGYEEVFQHGIVRDYPLELKRRDGHVTPVLYNATLYRDETGKAMGVFAAARDITEVKRAEETVKAERQRLYDVLEKLPVYTILLTPDYHVSFANRFFRERFGESHGKRCYEYLFNRMEPCEICETFTVQKTGKRHHWEWTGPDGRNYDIFDFPFTDFDGSPLIMEVGIDITERKQAEASLRSLASELVMAEERERKRIAGVLHDEVAQTLAAAKMHIDMLKGTYQEQTLKEAKSLLLQSIQETRALMNDIGNPLLFDMGLKAACESLADRLMERHPVRIICDIRHAFKHVNQDMKTILYQLVRELLNNVVKHSEAQNAHVLLDRENGHCRVKVTDDGVGFDPQTRRTPTIEGGFGLYSIQERLSAIGGCLRIESAPGSGTTVTAILPHDPTEHKDPQN